MGIDRWALFSLFSPVQSFVVLVVSSWFFYLSLQDDLPTLFLFST